MINTMHSLNLLLTASRPCRENSNMATFDPINPPVTECPQDLSYKDRHWHEECFHCFQCKRSLVDKPFSTKDEQLLCTECYSNEYSSKCHDCKKTIMPGERTHCGNPTAWFYFDLANMLLFQKIQTLQTNALTICSLVQSDKWPFSRLGKQPSSLGM